MNETMSSTSAQLLAGVQAALDALCGVELSSLAADEVLAVTVEVEWVLRTVPVLQHRLVRELDSREGWRRSGGAEP